METQFEWPLPDEVAKSLGDAKRFGANWRCRCPSHDDQHASLTVAQNAEGKLLINCKAGCSQGAVIEALKAKGLWARRVDGASPKPSPKPRIATSWEPMVPPPADAPPPDPKLLRCDVLHVYRDADGRVLHYVKRVEAVGNERKQFYPLVYGTFTKEGVATTGWHHMAPADPKPLYSLDLLAAQPDAVVIVCEGEKACDASNRMFGAQGYVSVTWSGGSSVPDKANWRPVAGRRIIVWPDADPAGLKAANKLHSLLAGSVLLNVEDLREGYDAADLEKETSDPALLVAWLTDRIKQPKQKLDSALLGYEASEDGIAGALIDFYGQDMRYCSKSWFLWDGTRWRPETTGLALEHCRVLARRLGVMCEPRLRASLGRANFAAGAERLARVDRQMVVTPNRWDQDLWLLNTPSGVINLRTGALRPHEKDAFCTKITSVAPTPEGTVAPRWAQFLQEITCGDEALQTYLQKVFGYTLTGDVSVEQFWFLHGKGANGKGTMLGSIAYVLGDYAVATDMATFTAAKFDRHPTEVARLAGARLVTASETETGRSWAIGRLKEFTGNERPLIGRYMAKDFFEFFPTFKLVFAGNVKPQLPGADEAMIRRLNVVPFKFIAAEPDTTLKKALQHEYPAILRWLIDGCLRWQQEGLKRPACVEQETEEYLLEQNAIASWVNECCETLPNAVVTHEALYQNYIQWALANGEEELNGKSFSQRLKNEVPGVKSLDHTPGSHGKRGFKGIALRGGEQSSAGYSGIPKGRWED